MPLDGLMLKSLTGEFQDSIIGARIERVYQPEKLTLCLNLHLRRGAYRLLISADSQNPRIYLTEESYANPKTPPMFCMLLRKHLEGGKITAVEQRGLERILQITIESRNEIGDPLELRLLIEIMGKHSNILLLDDRHQIIDAIKRYTHAVNRYREVQPGLAYVFPPSQGKLNLLETDEENFQKQILAQPLEQKLSKIITAVLEGFSPLLSRETVFRSGLDQNLFLENCGEYELHRLWGASRSIIRELKESRGAVLLFNNRQEGYQDFCCLPLTVFPASGQQTVPSPSRALDIFFSTAAKIGLREAKRKALDKLLSKEIMRCARKASLQKNTVDLAENAEQYRIAGELVTANIYRIQRGDRQLVCENFYSGRKETIMLESELSPAANAQLFFKKYNKAKHAAKQAAEQLARTRQEWDYLESLTFHIAQAENIEELELIEGELREAGYLKVKQQEKKAKKEHKIPSPLEFLSSDGFKILVGKNNKQNDQLTLKVANDHDLWFHVREMPGSHVIVFSNGQKVPDKTVEEAAMLAAYHSKARHSAKVPVDYTLKKHIKKPNGAKPGMVIYEDQVTVYVTPQEAEINRLKATP